MKPLCVYTCHTFSNFTTDDVLFTDWQYGVRSIVTHDWKDMRATRHSKIDVYMAGYQFQYRTKF